MTTYVFISDLHLSQTYPCLVQGFFALLRHYQAYPQVKLYILGDWFNAWLGDDVHDDWIEKIVYHLQQFNQAGHEIYFLVGNRDFALGQVFLNRFNAKLLEDITVIQIANKAIRLEHGDALCTDDVDYQRFKKIIRSPLVLNILKRLPLSIRQKLANGFRNKSKKANQYKPLHIMDVNTQAVLQAIQNIDILIHGHTHRPATHEVGKSYRIVLGDWREYSQKTHVNGEAMILEIDENAHFELKKWTY